MGDNKISEVGTSFHKMWKEKVHKKRKVIIKTGIIFPLRKDHVC